MSAADIPALTPTQRCVLKVLAENEGSLSWRHVKREIRRRSGWTVRPNASTLATLRKRGLVRLVNGWVQLAPDQPASPTATASFTNSTTGPEPESRV